MTTTPYSIALLVLLIVSAAYLTHLLWIRLYPVFRSWWLLDKPRALPIRRMYPDKYSWEDWEEETQLKYPFRYWVQETLPHWFRVHFVMNIRHAWYWLKAHTWHKYHMLDLRDAAHDYQWGWISPDNILLYSVFKCVEHTVAYSMSGVESFQYSMSEAEYVEAANKTLDFYSDTEQWQWAKDLGELYDCYRWWRYEHHDRLREINDDRNWRTHYERLSAFHEEESEVIRRVLAARNAL